MNFCSLLFPFLEVLTSRRLFLRWPMNTSLLQTGRKQGNGKNS